MPKRIGERTIFKSKHFEIKEIDLEFNTGKRKIHEIVDNDVQGVTVVPITNSCRGEGGGGRIATYGVLTTTSATLSLKDCYDCY